MDLLVSILMKAGWCGMGALGFGLLFNAPRRALVFIWLGGFVAGFVKFSALGTGWAGGVVSATFAASVAVGLLSIPVAHTSHVPPVVFSIPSVIPLVPGVYAYRTMIGLMKLTGQANTNPAGNLAETFQNGAVCMFIIMVIALGVAVPMHVLRQKSAKNLRFLPAGRFKKGNNLGRIN